MYERSKVLTGLHVYEEDRHHQVETGSAEANSVDRRVTNQHLTVAPAVRLVTHHVEERHLKHTHIIFYLPQKIKYRVQILCYCTSDNFQLPLSASEHKYLNFLFKMGSLL